LETTWHNFKQQYPYWWGRSRRERDGTTGHNNRTNDIDSHSIDGDGFLFSLRRGGGKEGTPDGILGTAGDRFGNNLAQL